MIDLLKKDKAQRGQCFISDALEIAIKVLEQKPNRRSEKLDKYLNKYVTIVFTDGEVKHGLLEFDRPHIRLSYKSGMYSLEDCVDCKLTFFRKSNVKKSRCFETESEDK